MSDHMRRAMYGEVDRLCGVAYRMAQILDAPVRDTTRERALRLIAHTFDEMAELLTLLTADSQSVTNTSNFQLTKTIADLVSGHIVGRGADLPPPDGQR